MHSLRLRNPRNPSQYHMKTCHKGKLSNRNVGSKDQGAVTKIYAKFTSMPYACKAPGTYIGIRSCQIGIR